MTPERIEEAALNAWPALRQQLYDGWLLRFAEGYTGRANSVSVIGPSRLDLDAKIDYCERQYAAHGLEVKFRVTPLFDGFALDQTLHEWDYRSDSHTSVQALVLRGGSFTGTPLGLSECAGVDEWLRVYARLTTAPPDQRQTHRAILRAIPNRTCFAVLAKDGVPVACGLGVWERDGFGLFNIVTDRARRGRGYGTRLVTGLLTQGRQGGASWAYLQVAEANGPARRLYETLGFEPVYRYWYRVKS